MINVILIGNGAREHAIAEAVMRSKHRLKLFSFMKANNPGIALISEEISIGSYSDLTAISAFARGASADFAIVGPEDPLNSGVVDALKEMGIPANPPKASLYVWAKVPEGYTSTEFADDLLEQANIVVTPGNGYGPNGEGYIRLSLTIADDLLEKGLARLAGWKNRKKSRSVR